MNRSRPKIVYTVELDNCRAHLIRVHMNALGASKNQEFTMPAWTPGSYMIREFAQHIVSIKAFEAGSEIAIEKLDKLSFRLGNTESQVLVSYEVYAFDSSIRAAFIDDQQAFFNGTALFLKPTGLDEGEYVLKITPYSLGHFAKSEVATGLRPMDLDQSGFGSYMADSYEEFVDHPVQISTMKRLRFDAGGIPHQIALVGDVREFDQERLKSDLAKLCTYLIELCGGANFSSYLFIARFIEGAYGGLEHRNSTMLLSSPYCLPKSTVEEPDHHYRSFLGLCAHEYYHAWNVKTLKPKSFVNYDFQRECYTDLLWLFEGITSYYDDLSLKRAGLISLDSYLDLLNKSYTRLLRNPGRRVQSLADSSFDAWIKFYRPNENSLNAGTSYYVKGSFLGLYLDLLIRAKNQHKVSLDDIMREAFKRYGSKGIDEAEFLALIKESSDLDVDDFAQRFIHGTEDFLLNEALSPFGLKLELLPDELYLDDKTKMKAFLGLRLKWENQRALIANTDSDGPAMRAGLAPEDELIAINGLRLEPENAGEMLASLKPKSRCEMVYARKKQLHNSFLETTELPCQNAKFSLKETLSDKERSLLAGLLGS